MDNNSITVGKDIIELVGTAMYLDPLTIYREYIQNSVDAIDEAIDAGILDRLSDARIDISVDATNRRILIRDNGIGIPESQFQNRMLAIGDSKKRKTDARGFRGIGRLAGLGYCQELIFRSRTIGGEVQQISWDIRKIKIALAEVENDGNIVELINGVTTSTLLKSDDFPDHFFEVELVRPLRIGQDVLLNVEKIRDYVSQVAPVPFLQSFSYAAKIRDFLNSSVPFREYAIYLNGDEGQIFKPYDDTIEFSETKHGELQEIDFFSLNSLDDGMAAVGWVVHHDYQGSIPKKAGVGGFRARVGNLQVGERGIFAEAFPEIRFNSWSVGEVHILDKRLIPNGRRDGFESGNHLSNLTSQLLPIGFDIAKRCRTESSMRNQFKRIESALLSAESIADILDQRAIPKEAINTKAMEAKAKLIEAKNIYDSEEFTGENNANILNRINLLEKRLKLGVNKKDIKAPLSNMPEEKRDTYREIFELIYSCSNNQQSAQALIDKLILRLEQ